MMRQRVLRYDEIDSPLIMLLDDDVELEPDSAEKMIEALAKNNLDCLAAVTFRNYKISVAKKFYIALTNMIFPHWSDIWSVIIHSNGSFSYNNHPVKDVYLSQSASGPAALWRKQVFLNLRLEDELWLDNLRFAFGEDVLMFNKLYKNGFRLGAHYSCGIRHLNAQSSSRAFKGNKQRFHTRSMASFLIWYRTCYNLDSLPWWRKVWAVISYVIKFLWLFFIHVGSSVHFRSFKVVSNYVLGVIDGLKMIKTEEFKQIPNFILS
jgi:GT2 family glycosyltransferase